MKPFLATLVSGVAGAIAWTLIGVSPAAAQPSEETGVWRLQVTFHTCDSNNADTDNSVNVSLNSANFTGLDRPGDDFERDQQRTYDLKLDGVGKLEDITRFRVRKSGGDAWCIDSFSLRVNGAEIFRSSTNRTLRSDDEARFTITGDTMRASGVWQGWTDPTSLPLTIDREQIEQRVTAIVGDAMQGNELMFGGMQGDRYVEAERRDADELRIDLDLEADVTPDPFDDPNVDVDFRLRFTCADGVITITPRAFSVTVSWPLGEGEAEEILDTLVASAPALPIDLGFCPTITIEENGDVVFDL
jgi:hypothetical protein